jgi:hypothetical protein
MKYEWTISLFIEPEREVENEVQALTVQAAIIIAIDIANLTANEQLHSIHISPRRETR